MMKVLTVLLLFTALGSAQTVSYTEDGLLAEYDRMFALSLRLLEYNGQPQVNVDARIADIDSGSVFAALAEKGARYIEYLLMHASELRDKKEEAFERGESSLYDVLKEDSRFSEYFYPVAARCLEARGISQTFTRVRMRAVPAEAACHNAARFMYPRWDKEGQMRLYNCIGINGWNGYEGERDISLEAFSYAAVYPEGTEDPLRNTFNSEIFDLLRTLLEEQGPDHEEIRRRLWEFVASHPSFEQMLKHRYMEMKEILPFAVPEWQQ